MTAQQQRLNLALASIWYRGIKPCGKPLCPLLEAYLKAGRSPISKPRGQIA